MGEVILVFAVIAIMIGGFFVMKRLDAFLEENRKAIEKENQKKEIPLMLLDAENNEKAISDIELFRQKHRDVRIVVYDESEVDLTETIKSYLNDFTDSWKFSFTLHKEPFRVRQREVLKKSERQPFFWLFWKMHKWII